jgi:hypothetical protein
MEIVTHVLTSEQPALQADPARMAAARKNIGLDNVENTADIDKPVSTATQAELDMKADRVAGSVDGKLPMLDSEGNLANSGITASIVVEDGEYRHITVESGSVSDGVNTFNQYVHPSYVEESATARKVGRDATGHVVVGDALTKGDLGLGNVDNTSDSDKPVSTATQTALNGKQDALPTPVSGKFLTSDTNGIKWGDIKPVLDYGEATDGDTVEIENNGVSTLSTSRQTLTMNVTPADGEAANAIVEIVPSVDLTLTVTVTKNSTATACHYSDTVGNVLAGGHLYQVSVCGTCWVMADFGAPT